MSAHIGLGVGLDGIRVVVVRRGRIVWTHVNAVSQNETLIDCISQTLTAIPRRWGTRYRLTAALGPSLAQLKSVRLRASNDRLLSDAISANSARFFLRNGVPLRVTNIRRDGPDSAWVAALEGPVIQAIEAACRAARVRFDGATPSLAVLHRALRSVVGSRTVCWSDHDIVGEVLLETGRLTRVTRRHSTNETIPIPDLVGPLKHLNGSGWLFADAYAAAVSNRRDPLRVRPSGDATRRRAWRVARRTALVLLLIGVGLAAMFVPGLMAVRVSAKASDELARLAPEQRLLAEAQQSISRINGALDRSAGFAKLPLMSDLLARLTEGAPTGTAALTLRVDSVGGTLIALSPSGAEVFAALSQINGISNPQITAPLTRETHEATELERVSIRFQLNGSQAPVSQSRGVTR